MMPMGAAGYIDRRLGARTPQLVGGCVPADRACCLGKEALATTPEVRFPAMANGRPDLRRRETRAGRELGLLFKVDPLGKCRECRGRRGRAWWAPQVDGHWWKRGRGEQGSNVLLMGEARRGQTYMESLNETGDGEERGGQDKMRRRGRGRMLRFYMNNNGGVGRSLDEEEGCGIVCGVGC
jgi:hypothetical protein